MYKEIEGDLISLAKEGLFDVITHGCNCQNVMGGGIAPLFAKAFGADLADTRYQESLEYDNMEWDRIEKLGNIEWWKPFEDYDKKDCPENLYVVNCYTQLGMGINKGVIPLDYEALTLCLRKMNYIFKGKHIGLPLIGCGLAGGSWDRVQQIIKTELKDCKVTIVKFKK